jgi:hypothetical protein
MEQSPSWEANRFSARQEFTRILWNPKVQYRIYKAPPPVPILSQMNPVHVLHPTYWRSILIFTYLRLGLPSGHFPSGLLSCLPYVLNICWSEKYYDKRCRENRNARFILSVLLRLAVFGAVKQISSSEHVSQHVRNAGGGGFLPRTSEDCWRLLVLIIIWQTCVISGFRREVDENCALLGCYVVLFSWQSFVPPQCLSLKWIVIRCKIMDTYCLSHCDINECCWTV